MIISKSLEIYLFSWILNIQLILPSRLSFGLVTDNWLVQHLCLNCRIIFWLTIFYSGHFANNDLTGQKLLCQHKDHLSLVKLYYRRGNCYLEQWFLVKDSQAGSISYEGIVDICWSQPNHVVLQLSIEQTQLPGAEMLRQWRQLYTWPLDTNWSSSLPTQHYADDTCTLFAQTSSL